MRPTTQLAEATASGTNASRQQNSYLLIGCRSVETMHPISLGYFPPLLHSLNIKNKMAKWRSQTLNTLSSQ